MTAKRKRKKAKSAAHIARRLRGIVQTPLRLAFDALLRPELDPVTLWLRCPSAGEVMDRLVSGRVSRDIVRAWINGRRRAPRWFVQVLRHELGERAQQWQAIDASLADLEAQAGDRRRGPIASARARALMMAGKGAIGRRKRLSGAPNATDPQKNDPHN